MTLAAAPRERPLVGALRRVIKRAAPRATESVKWNAPSFALSEHFATMHLRSRTGIQLVLHLGVAKRPDIDMRREIECDSEWLEWKGADRAIVTIRDAAHLESIQADLSKLLKAWSRYA